MPKFQKFYVFLHKDRQALHLKAKWHTNMYIIVFYPKRESHALCIVAKSHVKDTQIGYLFAKKLSRHTQRMQHLEFQNGSYWNVCCTRTLTYLYFENKPPVFFGFHKIPTGYPLLFEKWNLDCSHLGQEGSQQIRRGMTALRPGLKKKIATKSKFENISEFLN